MKFPPRAEGEGGAFLKLKDGESVIGIPRGEIHSWKQKWNNGKVEIIEEPDPFKHNRFAMNFLVKGKDGAEMKVWEYGLTVYNQLAEYAAEMDITTQKIKVTRKGSDKNTEYFLVNLGKQEIIPDVKLHILDKGKKAPSDNENHSQSNDWGPEPSNQDEEIPF